MREVILNIPLTKLGRGIRSIRQSKKQHHDYLEDIVKSQLPISPAYHRARSRGFIEGMEQDDWVTTDTEAKGQRRTAT